jgi:broad specificity phosphatase PhoE
MMPQVVWIARHGNRLDFVRPEWFDTAKRRYDPPLSEDGLIQARKLARRLKSANIKHIFSSPFLRTIQTANQVAEALDLPIWIERGLGEWLNPDWMTEMPETHPEEELTDLYPRIDWSYASKIVPEYPESEKKCRQRMQQTAFRLIDNYKEDILLVGHAASILGITQGLIEGNPTINYSLCCLVKLLHNGSSWNLELNGDTSHLS